MVFAATARRAMGKHQNPDQGWGMGFSPILDQSIRFEVQEDGVASIDTSTILLVLGHRHERKERPGSGKGRKETKQNRLKLRWLHFFLYETPETKKKQSLNW